MRSDGLSGLSRKCLLGQINDLTSPSRSAVSPTSHTKLLLPCAWSTLSWDGWEARKLGRLVFGFPCQDSLHSHASPSPSLRGTSIFHAAVVPTARNPEATELLGQTCWRFPTVIHSQL